MTLAALVFSTSGLDWTPLDHCESFAGDMSVTLGEWQERQIYE